MTPRGSAQAPSPGHSPRAGAETAAEPAAPPPPPARRLAFRSRAAIYLGLGTLQRALALILAPLYAHSLSPAEFGLLTFLLSLEALFGVVMDLGLSSGVVRACFQVEGRQRESFLAYAQFASLIASGIVFLGLGLACMAYVAIAAEPMNVAVPLGLTLISALAQRVNGLAAALYRAQEDARSFALLSIARIIAIPLLSIAVAVALDLGLVAILLIRILVCGATGAYELRQAWHRRDAQADPGGERELLGASLRHYGLPLLPHNLMRWGRAQGMRVLLGGAMSMPLLALYSVASLPLQMLSLTGTAADQLFEPFYYRERTLGTPAAIERLHAAAELVLAGQAAMVIAAMMIVPDIFGLMFPAIYRPAGLYAPLLAAGQYLTMIQAVCFKPLIFMKRANALPAVTGVSTIAGAVLTFGAALEWQMAGATFGYVATTAIAAVLAMHFVHRVGRDPTVPRAASLLLCLIVLATGTLPLVAERLGYGEQWLGFGSLWLRVPLHLALAALAVLPVLLRHRVLALAILRGTSTRTPVEAVAG